MAITTTVKSVRVCNPSQVAVVITASDGTRSFDVEIAVDSTLTPAQIQKVITDRKPDYAQAFALAAQLQAFVGTQV